MRARWRRDGVGVLGALAVAAGSLAIPPGVVAQAAAGPRFGENFRLASNTSARGRDVPGLAVDPVNPSHIVEADINPINLQCDYHVSFDGGRTWTGDHLTIRNGGEDPPFPTPACDQNFDAGGYAHFNTGIVFGSGQNVYITFSAHRGDFIRLDTSPPTEGGAGDDSVVARSTDGGRTFQPAVVAIPGAPTPQPVSIRPQIAVQRRAGIAGQDRLYANAWQLHVTGLGGPRRMLVARSDDGGATWTTPEVASAFNVRTPAAAATVGTPDEMVRELSQPVVGPDAAVYAAYRNRDATDGTSSCPANPNTNPAGQHRNCIVVARSTDLGQSWTQSSTKVPLFGNTGQPRLAMDPTVGTMGKLYVAYHKPDASGDPDEVYLQSSTDGGQTWSSPPTRVNDDPIGSAQVFPQVSVGPNARVDVIWFDTRHPYPGGGNTGDIYYARSSDGGASFDANRRVTDRTFNRDVGIDSFLGSYDFYGPVSQPLGADGSALTAWMDPREGNADNGFQDIYLSRLEGNAQLAKSTIATASTSGLSVMLSRLAYPGGPEAAGPEVPITKLVVANENDVPAALAGAVLARANWGSLLLSPAGGMPAVVKADATRMKPEGGYVIGDTSSLSTTVSSDLRDATRNGENVSRVAAASSVGAVDRPAEVARQIAELMRPLPVGTGGPEAVIANPATPEAASASALAAALKLPILFVDDRTDLPDPTLAAIDSLGIKKALIVGGTGAVNAEVQTSLNTKLGAGNVRRVGGADQYSTSEAVLIEAKSRGLPANVVYVADGARPIDGALLGAAVGRVNGLMLFTPGANLDTAESRLNAIGVATSTVDRLVAAVGAGGTDPVVPASASGLTSSGTNTPGASADSSAPVVSNYRLTNNPFAVGGRTPTFGVAAKAKKHKKGTTFRYTLSEPATVKLTISRRLTGRRSGKRCIAPTRRLRKAKKCTRTLNRGTLNRTSHQGANSVAFSGRIGSTKLSPGRYQATLTATDTARNTSKTKTITFTIAKR